MNIEYIMMDESNIVGRCLHDGTIPEDDASSVVQGMNQNSVEIFLILMCKIYGSCAVLAKNGGKIIGFIRFYPRDVLESFDSFDALCIQWREKCIIKPGFDLQSFPKKDDLSKKDLTIQCFQVGSKNHRNRNIKTYKGQGIAKKMLQILITWAKQHDWDKITANAINHIKPLLLWSGMYSVDRFKELGFKVVNSSINPGLREGVVSQRSGFHGKEIHKMWDDYSDITYDEAARAFEVEITL